MGANIDRICKQAVKGNRAAAVELLKMFHARIFAYLRRLCGNHEDAEDLTQETFAKVWASLPEFRDCRKFTGWIHRIAYRTYVDWHRKRTPTISRTDLWWENLPSKDRNQSETTADREIARKLWRAVENLDEDKRQTIHLHYYQGLSLRETAHVLDIATSTVKYRLREAMKILRKEMQETHIPAGQQEPHIVSEVETR